jgi:predicted NUDIX family phosphoesterase
MKPLSTLGVLHALGSAGLWLGPRDDLEGNSDFLQIIPYVVLRQGGKIVKYTRTPKGGESRLHGKVSIGAGGHIDARDVRWAKDSTVRLAMTLSDAACREVDEEFGFQYTSLGTSVGLLVDLTDDVQRVHVGVVMVWDLADNFAVESKEDSQSNVSLATLEELEADRPRMEKWSKHVLDYLISQR